MEEESTKSNYDEKDAISEVVANQEPVSADYRRMGGSEPLPKKQKGVEGIPVEPLRVAFTEEEPERAENTHSDDDSWLLPMQDSASETQVEVPYKVNCIESEPIESERAEVPKPANDELTEMTEAVKESEFIAAMEPVRENEPAIENKIKRHATFEDYAQALYAKPKLGAESAKGSAPKFSFIYLPG